MKIKKIIEALSKKLPNNYYFFDSYIILNDYEHVLSGFSLELIRGRIYLNKFVFPLFEVVDFVTLLYSERICDEKFVINCDFLSLEGVVEMLISVLDEKKMLNNCSFSLDDFCKLVQTKNGLIDHPHAQLILAFALILKNNFEEAYVFLEKSLPYLAEPYGQVCDKFIFILENDPEKAKVEVLKNEITMIEKLKLK